jgi:hypothetical protein
MMADLEVYAAQLGDYNLLVDKSAFGAPDILGLELDLYMRSIGANGKPIVIASTEKLKRALRNGHEPVFETGEQPGGCQKYSFLRTPQGDLYVGITPKLLDLTQINYLGPSALRDMPDLVFPMGMYLSANQELAGALEHELFLGTPDEVDRFLFDSGNPQAYMGLNEGRQPGGMYVFQDMPFDDGVVIAYAARVQATSMVCHSPK